MTLLHSGYQPTYHPAKASNRDLKPPTLSSDDESDLRMGMMRRGSDFSENSYEHRSRNAYAGRDTDRFFGDFEDDEACSEIDEEPAELVPMGGGRGGRGRTPRTPKKSYSSTGFYDFYKLTDEHLGAGAYASVKTCTSLTTGKEYAVKVVDKNEESHTRSRIMREVNTFNLCKNHPNIVQLIEWFEDENNFYMVFEKMRGGPLLQHILTRGYFTEEEARRVTKDIASALKFLHDRGVAHRDVKPENVLCTEPDRVSPVKLCDLDLASRAVKTNSARQHLPQVASEPDLASPVGSAEFMAPEVVDAFVGEALKYDKRCDMWSLGVILYIMLCGYVPFQGRCADEDCGWMDGKECEDCQQDLFARIQRGQYDFPEDEWAEISLEARDLVSHLLMKNVAERFTADQVLSHPWIQQSAPPTVLQTPGNLYRKDSARDVQQMTENFTAMSRFTGHLSSRMERLSLEEDGAEPVGGMPPAYNKGRADPFATASRASPTTPPPSMETADVPTGDSYSDSASFAMFTPSTLRSASYFTGSYDDDFIVPNRDDISMLSLESANSANRNIVGVVAAAAADVAETCQGAMVAHDSKSDLHQQTRETEVQV
ncbi:unnamed protein product [Caenorhabditis auriculariae]|uniref:Protein kinase domain-containing protein n=1 Tax=Caenorhabditis auriculariae TaxID=2777116 RepID=A0A8S1H7E5_9PELO|nr:unnamed protein product [Caenorhabditis auriculariae]